MLRLTLSRSALQTGRRCSNASRTFATSGRRHAEVQLTIGIGPGLWIGIAVHC